MKRFTSTPALAALVAVLLPACTSWEHVRDQVMTPVNELVHRAYPRAMARGALDEAVAMHTADTLDAARAEHQKILALVARPERAECVIERIQYRSDTEIELEAWLSLRGASAAGPVAIEQRLDLVCRREADAWRIARRHVRSERIVQPPRLLFRDESATRGLDFPYGTRGVLDSKGVRHPYAMGSGCAVADVDGDGWTDVLLVAGDRVALFRNEKGHLGDATAQSGLAAPPSGECRFGIWGDVDGDGDPDLFLATLDGPHWLYLNDGTGRFELREPAATGLQSNGHATSACWADFDGDGLLDLYVACGNNHQMVDPDPVHTAKNAPPNQLYKGRGDGTFIDVTAASGTGDTGWALAVAAADYDDDGDVDLYVGNDFGPDMLYRNRGDGTFEDVAAALGITHRGSSMGVAWADLNNDGRLDLYVTQMCSGSRWMTTMPGFPAPAPWYVTMLFRSRVLELMGEMLAGNRTYLAQADGTFEDVAFRSDTHNAGWGWGGVAADFDRDGTLDLYVLDGFVSGEDKTDC